ncbi:hypothetical protein AMATHDRAFT_8083 [Amanita thiersii Skay4041]|uniref:Uncharacterized protein n=1 Tax=Amanita thiersii Skay4041 TaxID=703135 RepID=A0A2A9NEN0_9AGAR|nr:hypothetical protein AMATHDRAFT_8083 [Amanita thiersii Skay4041]
MAEEAKKWEIIEANWDAWNNASSNFLKKEVEGRNATFTAVYKIAKQPRLDWGDGPDNDHKISYINSWLEDQKKFNQPPPKVIYFEGVDEKCNEYRCIHKTYRDYFVWQKKQDEKVAMEVQNDSSLPSIPAPKFKGKQKALLPSPSSSSSLYVSSGKLEKTLNELFNEMAIEHSKTEKSNWKGKLANAGPSNQHQGPCHKGKTLGTTKMSLGEFLGKQQYACQEQFHKCHSPHYQSKGRPASPKLSLDTNPREYKCLNRGDTTCYSSWRVNQDIVRTTPHNVFIPILSESHK